MQDKNYTVYEHVNKINGLIYIGITHQKPEKRWLNGIGYKHNPHFYNAIKKYGWDRFEHKILHEHVDKETACILERMYISFYKKRNMSYNIAEGGEGTESFSEETRLKISKANKGEKHWDCTGKNHPLYGKHRTEETKKKISEAQTGPKHHLYGKHRTEETKKKIGDSNRGKHRTEEVKSHLSEVKKGKYLGKNNPMYGKHHTEETKRKMSENSKGKSAGINNPMYGKHHTEETKKKLSKSHKGKHHTEETKRKMSKQRRGKNSPVYGKGMHIKIDNDPIIYTAQEAADKYQICVDSIRKRLKKSNPAIIKPSKTKISHIIYKV